MSISKLFIGLALTLLVTTIYANTPPDPQGIGSMPDVSAQVGDSVSWDISGNFSDPDGDDLTFHWDPESEPLPAGLSLDSATGIISGTVLELGGVGLSVWFQAEDTSGARSGYLRLPIHKKVTNGAFTDIFFRECDPTEPMCIPGYDYNRFGYGRGPVPNNQPDSSQSSAQYPSPPEATRAAASVGYEGEELTPAISMYMRPANERFTGYQFGIARNSLSADVSVTAELTYTQTGGVLAPVMPPLPEELPYGAIWEASLFAFTMDPAANDLFDASLCDWVSAGFGSSPWGVNPRGLVDCILRGIHPHVLDLQIAEFSLPPEGDGTPGNGFVTSSVTNGVTQTQLFLERDPLLPEDPVIFIGILISSMARYGGEVDSQNTLRISFDNLEAIAPEMPEVTQASFQPAPESGGEVLINDGECINLNGYGRIPIVIKGGEYMPANLIDADSIEFAGLELASRGPASRSKPACSIDDFDLDSFDDLICQFIDDPGLWTGGPGGATTITWSLANVIETYSGSDWICLE